jgi:hypothetical protein
MIKTLRLSSLVLVALLFAPLARAQKIEIGTPKATFEKRYPMFAKEFREHSTAIRISTFPLHGLKGDASFLFDKGALLVFTWEHPKDHKEGLTVQDLKNYNALFKGLQSDWGKGNVTKSPYNKAVKEATWKLAIARGSIRYNPDKIRVQMIDAAYLERTKKKVK